MLNKKQLSELIDFIKTSFADPHRQHCETYSAAYDLTDDYDFRIILRINFDGENTWMIVQDNLDYFRDAENGAAIPTEYEYKPEFLEWDITSCLNYLVTYIQNGWML